MVMRFFTFVFKNYWPNQKKKPNRKNPFCKNKMNFVNHFISTKVFCILYNILYNHLKTLVRHSKIINRFLRVDVDVYIFKIDKNYFYKIRTDKKTDE